MIIDAHVHLFPDQGGEELGRPRHVQLAMMQRCVGDFWGRMVTSHEERKFIPTPDEDVDFDIADYGRWTWQKHGQQCWLQRATPIMRKMEHTPAQLLAAMDTAGVDVGIVQTDIEYMDNDYARDHYFDAVFNMANDRLVVTAPINYNLSQSAAHLERELAVLERCLAQGFRGVYLSGVGLPAPLDDSRCDDLWQTILRLQAPVYVQTGFCSQVQYRDELQGLLRVLEKYPALTVIESHFGGNLLHPSQADHTDVLEDLTPLMETRQFYLELGYVLGYEDARCWGSDARYPFDAHNTLAHAFYDRFGSDRLVWGSDVPWCYRVCTYQQAVDLVKHHTPYMTDDERADVLGGNLARVFNLTRHE